MSMRLAGQLLAGISVGGIAGYGANELMRYAAEQAMPAHSREMTQEEHARNNLAGFRRQYSKVTPEEMALYEGLRQGLMAGEISGSELNILAKEGRLPQRVITLLTDVHDWSADEPYPFAGRTIPEVMESAPEQLGYTGIDRNG